MNILVFCDTAASGKGGMEKTAINLANYLSHDHDSFLGFFYKDGLDKPSYSLSYNVRVLKRDLRKESITDYIYRVSELGLDLIIYFSVGPGSVKFISGAGDIGVPVLIHEGSNPERVISYNWVRKRKVSKYQAIWERECVYSKASAIRFTMVDYIESLPSFMRNNCRVFPNAFDLPEVSAKLDSKKIINVGGLKKNKNIVPLIDAVALVFQKYPDWSLSIFSSPPKNAAGKDYVDFLERRIKSLGLSQSVFISGEVDNIYDYYLGSSVHVITSLSEGLSNAVCEAMCCGVPTVGIRGVPGVDGVVKDLVNGLLVDGEALVDDLAAKLEKIIEDKYLRISLGGQARKDAFDFDPDRIFRKWDEIIDFAVSDKAKSALDEVCIHYSHCEI